MFLELFQDLLYGFHMWLAWVFGEDQDVIQIYHNKDIKLFGKDRIDVILKTSGYIQKAKR